MNIKPEIMISAAAVLLASQVAVIIVLIVLCKRFKTLKDEVHKYKVKQNRASLSKLVVKDPREKKKRPCNEYVDGKRHPQTLVKTNSKESIVYVPTPALERRSKNLESNGYELDVVQSLGDPSTYTQEDEIYGNQVVIDMVENGMEKDQTLLSEADSLATVINDPSTPCIEEIKINPGYKPDADEIHGNQVVIGMAEKEAVSFVGDGQINTANVNVDRNGLKSKNTKTRNFTSMESERTTEAGDTDYEVDNTNVNHEPIYENLRGR